MKTELRLKIEQAIWRVLEKECEHPSWPHCLSDNLVELMVDAAEAVFDAGQDGQEYAENNK